MTEKIDKNNDLESLDQEAMISDNYSVEMDEEIGDLYVEKTSHRHLKLWSFLILVIFIFILAGFRFYGNFFEPLKLENEEWIAQQLNPENQNQRSIEELKGSDTDQDGLTDYQELYQYYTSIFLPDTDSDGMTDAEEVSIGEDPLCPINEECNLLRLITPETKLSSIINDINLDPNLTIQQAAVAEFRKFLEEGGMPKEDLDALTDEDLLNIFKIVDENQIFDEGQLNASTTPQEVRDFLLILPGVDQEEIDNLSDEELMELAEEIFSK